MNPETAITRGPGRHFCTISGHIPIEILNTCCPSFLTLRGGGGGGLRGKNSLSDSQHISLYLIGSLKDRQHISLYLIGSLKGKHIHIYS